MKVTIWGSRGSITTPGVETVRYGGESTCFEVITDDNETIIIDAGSGIRKLGNKILHEPGDRNITLLLTHSHWDHLVGFPFFKPAFVSRFTINVCGGPDAQDSVFRSLQHQMEPPYFPVDMDAMKATFVRGCRCGKEACGRTPAGINGAHQCESIPLNHPNGGFGFKFTGNTGKIFVLLTDNELQYNYENGRSRDEYAKFCEGADLLFHDAQYSDEEYAKKKGWGHSTFSDAVDLAIDAGVRRLGLLHHDPERSDNELDQYLEWCKEHIRKRKSSLECFICTEGMNIEV